MNLRPPAEGLVGSDPLSADMARLLVGATPGPVLVVDVDGDPAGDGAFRVVAVDPVLRRLITGAVHPAGPRSDERIEASGFGLLGVDLLHAARTCTRVVTELPVGDEPRWYEVVVTPIVQHGRCRQLIAIGADRTADHDVEARQRRAARRFRAMVEHAPGLILLVDSSARIIRASANAAAILGFGEDELTGRQIFELVHPDSLGIAAAAFADVLVHPGEDVPLADFRLVRSNGTTMWCKASATNHLGDDDIAAIVVNANDVTLQRLAEQKLLLAVTHDDATGLPNRRGLEEHLGELFGRPVPDGGESALALVTIEGLDLVHDGLGPRATDDAVRTLADQLRALVGEDAALARVAVDCFAIAIHRPATTDAAELIARLATAVHETLRTPIVVDGDEFPLRATIGTAVARLVDSTPATLVRNAELACGRAKALGLHGTVAFDPGIRRAAEERLRRVTDLQRALRTERLRLAYQPVLDARGDLVGAEALLRWARNGVLLAPSEFLELAEQTGLIIPIGAWVIDRACADLAALQRTVPTIDWVSVNVSAQQLCDERFPALVHRSMDAYGIGAGGLGLEVDAGDLLGVPDVAASMAELSDVSLMVACDDLATDQTILHRLGTLPVSALKLDRGLVGQLDVELDGQHRSLTGATVDLAAELGIDVIAQGVETERQAAVLTELGVGLMQGFHLAPPMDLATLMTRARARVLQRTPGPTGREGSGRG